MFTTEACFPKIENIPDQYKITSPLNQDHYLLDGQILTWSGPMEEVYSPIHIYSPPDTEPKAPLIGRYPKLSRKESLEALSAAEKAYNQGQGHWPTMTVEERIECIKDFVFRMKQKRSEVINLLMWEIGKSLPDSEKEFDRTVDYIEDTIDALKELDRNSSRFQLISGVLAQIRRSPLGIVLCMGPFNYPLNETFTTLIPAMMMGNTVIFKPPKLGVLLFAPLLEAFQKSFPPGVINTVFGDGPEVVAPLMESGKINCLAFIGSSKVADILKGQHPLPHRLRCVLGLEAKNPGIILSDADLKSTIEECLLGSFSFNGQRCTALKILFVHENLITPFLQQFSTQIDALPLGTPWEKGTKITPLPEPNKVAYLKSLIADAEQNGGKVVNARGGQSSHTYFAPTLIYPLNPKMRLYHEEQFGPIIGVVPFSNIQKPIRYLLDSPYGQQVALFGRDEKLLANLIDPLVNQVCRVNINSQCQRGPDQFPFTGRKDSAEGTLSISDALKVFSIRSVVSAKQTDENRRIFSSIVKNRYSQFLSTDFIF